MRILLAVAMLGSAPVNVWACSCIGVASPCHAAGQAAAVFTGTVLAIKEPVAPVPEGIGGQPAANRIADARVAGAPRARLPRRLRVVRLQVGEVLSGIAPGQKEIEIETGGGGGDCGYAFQQGGEYVVYAYKNSEGRLETNICVGTRELAQAPEDLRYLRSMANAPATGEIRVLTGYPDAPGRPGAGITVESGGVRYSAITDAAGDARFTGLSPGEYAIHAESDGDLPEDPQVRLHAKGCVDVTLFRTLVLTGRVTTRGGLPAAQVEVQFRAIPSATGDGVMTDQDGRYKLRILRRGQYYLGVNLNNPPARETRYPRWFFPGTTEQALATVIDFSGRPAVLTYDFSLPDFAKVK